MVDSVCGTPFRCSISVQSAWLEVARLEGVMEVWLMMLQLSVLKMATVPNQPSGKSVGEDICCMQFEMYVHLAY